MKLLPSLHLSIAILFISIFLIPINKSAAAMYPDSVVAVKAILSGCGDSKAGLHEKIIVYVSQLGRLQRSLNGKPLVLFINGLPLMDIKALSIDTLLGEIQFAMERTDTTKSTWNLILGRPKSSTKSVTISVGLVNGTPISCQSDNFTLIVIRPWQFWIFICSLLVMLLVIFLLYQST